MSASFLVLPQSRGISRGHGFAKDHTLYSLNKLCVWVKVPPSAALLAKLSILGTSDFSLNLHLLFQTPQTLIFPIASSRFKNIFRAPF